MNGLRSKPVCLDCEIVLWLLLIRELRCSYSSNWSGDNCILWILYWEDSNMDFVGACRENMATLMGRSCLLNVVLWITLLFDAAHARWPGWVVSRTLPSFGPLLLFLRALIYDHLYSMCAVHFLLQHMHRHTCPTFLQCTPLTLHLMKSPPHMLHTPHQQRLLLTFLQHLHQCLHLTQHRLDHLHPHTTLLVLGLPAPCRILARLPTNLQLPQLIPLSSLHWPRHILHGWLLPIPLLLLQSLFTRHLGLLTLHPSHQVYSKCSNWSSSISLVMKLVGKEYLCGIGWLFFDRWTWLLTVHLETWLLVFLLQCLLLQSLQRLTHPSLPLMHQGLPLSLMSPSLPHQPRLRCHLVMTFRYPANLLHLLLYPYVSVYICFSTVRHHFCHQFNSVRNSCCLLLECGHGFPEIFFWRVLYRRTLGQNLPQNHGSCQHWHWLLVWLLHSRNGKGLIRSLCHLNSFTFPSH